MWGCSTPQQAGQCQNDGECNGQFCVNGGCVQCRADNDCAASNKCMVCQNGACAEQGGDCCMTDVDCGAGRRCWNVPGKPYGRCGNR
jgi:hypothetical protein